MNYFNESYNQETEIKKSYDKTNLGAGVAAGEGMQMGCDGKMMGGMNAMPNCCATPVYECPQERVCHRYICHEVPHIMPCNTRIINHHVFRHTYTPEYTCCEENVCENVFGPRCC